MENERDNIDDSPYLFELAHYEYTETAVSIDKREIMMDGIDPDGNLLDEIPVLNPVAMPLSYKYPVHTISPNNLPQFEPEQPTFIVVYRDRKDEVGFIELNPVSARLLELIKEDKDLTGHALLELIANELKHPNPDVVINGGVEIMKDLHAKDVILGVKIENY